MISLFNLYDSYAHFLNNTNGISHPLSYNSHNASQHSIIYECVSK